MTTAGTHPAATATGLQLLRGWPLTAGARDAAAGLLRLPLRAAAATTTAGAAVTAPWAVSGPVTAAAAPTIAQEISPLRFWKPTVERASTGSCTDIISRTSQALLPLGHTSRTIAALCSTVQLSSRHTAQLLAIGRLRAAHLKQPPPAPPPPCWLPPPHWLLLPCWLLPPNWLPPPGCCCEAPLLPTPGFLPGGCSCRPQTKQNTMQRASSFNPNLLQQQGLRTPKSNAID